MSLLRRTAQPRGDEARNGTFSISNLAALLANDGIGGPQAGNVDKALRDAATWACIKVKAQGIASLPVDVIRMSGSTRIPVPTPEFIANPSGLVSRRVWTFQVAWSLFVDGNAFGRITRKDSMGRPLQIETIAPDKVTRREVVDGIPQAYVGEKLMQVYPFGDLWHLPGEMVAAGSPFGLSPLTYGSHSVGTSLAAEEFGGRFFTDGGHPTAIVTTDRDPGVDGAKALKQRIREAVGGINREPLVLPNGITWQQIQTSPSDSQFLDLMRFEVEQTCRRHGVPPNMVFAAVSGQNVTYSNVSQADLAYLKHTLSYPISLIEDALSGFLPAPRIVRFNRDAILRADTLTRYQAHEIALRNRWATVNEVRAIEDLSPLSAEFDEPGVPPMTQPELPFDDSSDDDEGGTA